MLKTYLLISILLLWCFVGIYSYIYVCKFLPYCFALPPHSCCYSPQCNYQVGMLLIILLLLWVSLPTHLLLIFLSLMSLHLTPPAYLLSHDIRPLPSMLQLSQCAFNSDSYMCCEVQCSCTFNNFASSFTQVHSVMCSLLHFYKVITPLTIIPLYFSLHSSIPFSSWF